MEALLVRKDTYEQNRDYVLGVLGRRCRWLDDDDREAALHDAYAVLLEKEREGRLDIAAMHPNQLRAYFTQTAINKALDEGKRADRKRVEPLGERALAEPDPGRAPEELVSESLDSARMGEIVGELPERAQTIVKLRFYFDRTPEEIQDYMRISERVYRRELERAIRRIADVYRLVREDTFCDSRRSLILAYVAGIAGPGRMAKAREHLAACPGCAHWAAELRVAAEKAAALLPLPPITMGEGPFTRLAESLAGLRDGFVDAGGAVKQQAGALAGRVDAATPQYVAGTRPGALAAALAGCVAIGSGATYCVLEGVPGPLTSMAGIDKQAEKPAPKPPARKARAERAAPQQAARPQPPPVVSTIKAPAQPAQPSRPKRERTPGRTPAPAAAPAQPSTVPPAPPPVQEFGFEEPVQPGGGGSPGTAGAPPAAPAPAPSPPGEFDP